MAWYYDAHTHLSDPLFAADMPMIFTQMNMLQIKACCVSVDYESSLRTLDLSGKSGHVLPFLGIHPEHAEDDLDRMCVLIEENHSRISGIGEIGIDPSYVQTDGDYSLQRRVFERMLEVAEQYDKPVSIHSRKSLNDVYDIMSSFSTEHALLHWFDGSKRQLGQAMDMGFFVSYGPVSVYANDKQVLISNTDESRILVETDGPVLFSRCFDMKPGHVTFIPSVIFCVSKAIGRSFDEAASVIEANTCAYLGI